MPNRFSTRSTYFRERNRSIKRDWNSYQGSIKDFAHQWGISIPRVFGIIMSDRKKIVKLLRQKEEIDQQLVNILQRET